MKYLPFFYSLLFLALLTNCGGNNSTQEESTPPEGEELVTTPQVTLPADLLDGSIPPYDVAKNASVLDNAIFAWREIIALSWQSTYTQAIPVRATPDTEWNYTKGTPVGPLVWETYAHRIEYRPKGDVITKSFDSPPSYDFVPPVGNSIDWNGIDPSSNFVVLDEDNEIGSCYIFTDPNVTMASNGASLVMYMAKVNRTEYDFRRKNFNSSSLLQNALNQIAPPKGSKNVEKLKEISLYSDPTGADPCGAMHYAGQGVLVFPCSDQASQKQGVIEIKTAWRPLTASDDRTKFLVRNAVSFTKDVVRPADTVYRAQQNEYILLGMHIIHKTNNFRQFFIATWEHNSLESFGYKFAYESNDTFEVKVLPVARHDDSDGAYSRNMETYGAISDAVQAKIKAANPDNFLANYRLTGFQSNLYPDLPLADRKTTMPTYYLANLVIESDTTLADFSGSSIGSPSDNGINITTDGKLITTGGCSGCHGAGAQQKGSDFSFLNDFIGKPIPVPDPRVLVGISRASQKARGGNQ